MFLLKVPDGSIQLDLLRELSDYEVRLKEKDEEIAKLKKSVEFNFEIIKQVKIKISCRFSHSPWFFFYHFPFHLIML